MKYEKPKLEIEVFDSDIVTTGRGMIYNSGEGGVNPWPSGATPAGVDLPPM